MKKIITKSTTFSVFGQNVIFQMLYVTSIVFMLSNCQSPEQKRWHSYYTDQCTHVDSIRQYFFVEKDPEKYVQNICNVQGRMDRLGLADSADKMLGIMQDFANTSGNKRFFVYHNLNYAYHYMILGEYDKAWNKFLLREKFAAAADINNQLMAFNFLGSYYYMIGEPDSASMALVKGYRLSKDVGDTILQFTLALNAGAAYHDLGMFGASSYYFSEAYSYSQKHNKPSLMLVNNLVASLTSELKYDRAIALCEQNREQWMKDPNDRAAVLLKLNYANLLLMRNDVRKSGEILKLINFQLIDPLHIPLYRSIESEVILDKGDISGFKEHIDTLKPMIYENQPRSIIKFKHVLLKSLQFMDFPLSIDSIQTFYNDAIKQDELELVARVEYASLLSGVYKNQGNANLARLWETRFFENQMKMADFKDSLHMVDIDVQLDQTTMKNAMVEKQLEIERETSSNRLLTYLSIFLMVLLVSAIIGLALYVKNGKKRNNIITLEAKLVKQELEMLRQEKELKENVVAISQSILEEVSGIGQRLRTAGFARDPEAISIRLDLERLAQLSQSVIQPSLSEVVYESYDYLFVQYPQLKALNTTERRILILTVLGNKPREIAALLKLNDQYIRNVKSKIKKLLATEPGVADWSDLKQKL